MRSGSVMTMRAALCLMLLAAASCGDFPRDSEDTLKRVRAEGVFRVGLVAPLGDRDMDAEAAALLDRVGKAAGAAPRLERGDAEPLLLRLQEGDLQLVIGRFEAKSPWAKLVSFSPPLRREMQGKNELHLVATMQNGENAWIGLVEREARTVAPDAQ